MTCSFNFELRAWGIGHRSQIESSQWCTVLTLKCPHHFRDFLEQRATAPWAHTSTSQITQKSGQKTPPACFSGGPRVDKWHQRQRKDTWRIQMAQGGGLKVGWAAVSRLHSNLYDGMQHHTLRCSPSTFNLTSHLRAEGNGGGVINHPTVWLVRGIWPSAVWQPRIHLSYLEVIFGTSASSAAVLRTDVHASVGMRVQL